jgi:hypothetical protein
MQNTEVQSAVMDHFNIVVVNEDAAGNEIKKTWRLVYDYLSIAKIEKAIGRDIKKISSWKDLSSGTDFPAIVHGGLNRYHPDVTLDEVLDVLNPAAQRVLSDEIFYLMFPGMREVIEKQAETGAAADSNPPAATLSA